jgi:very-short-patch-repair endonuclease
MNFEGKFSYLRRVLCERLCGYSIYFFANHNDIHAINPSSQGGIKGGCNKYLSLTKKMRHTNKIIPYKPYLKKLARELRKNSTLSEILLWQEIKGKTLGYEFHRQVPLDKYIVDFYCHELMLAIEIDGCSHDFDDTFENDKVRQEKLKSFGVKFLRFDDLEIKKDVANVIEIISE